MIRLLKITALVVAFLVALVLMAVVALQFVSGEQYKKLIQIGVHSTTGRQLVIDGELNVGFASHLTFDANQVRLANPEWGSRPEMFSADRIQGDLALLPMLRGILDFSLTVDRPDLLLETNTQGEGNWVMGEPKTEEPASFPLKPLIRELGIHQGRVTYRSGAQPESDSRQPLEMVIDTLRLGQQSGKDDTIATDQPLLLELEGAYNGVPVTLSSTLESVDELAANQPAKLKADIKAGDTALAASGSLGPLSPNADLNLTLRVDAPSLSAFAPFTGGKIPELGPLSVNAIVSGTEGVYALSDLQAKLDAGQTSASVTGSVAQLNGLEGIDISLRANTEDLSELLRQSGLDLPYPLPRTAHAEGRVSGSVEALAIDELTAQAVGDGLQVSLTGSAVNILALDGVSGNASIRADSLDKLSAFVGRPLPSVGPLESSARIVPGASGFALEDFSAKLEHAIVSAKANGSVANLKKLEGIQIDLEAKTTDLAALLEGAAVELPYPPPQSLQTTAKVSGSLKQLAIENLVAEVQDEGVKIAANGSATNLLGLDGIDLDVTIEADSLDRFSTYANTELPALGPLTGAVKMTASQGVLALPSIEATLESEQLQAAAKGSISNLLALNGIDLDVTASSDALAEILKQLQIESPVPPPHSVEATAKLTGNFEKLALVDFKAKAQDPGVRATITGKAENLLQREGIEADLKLNAEQLSKLSQYVGTDLPDLGPLEATAHVSSTEDSLRVNAIMAELSDQGFAAKVSGSIEDVINLEGMEASINLDIDSLSRLNSALESMLELDLPATTPLKAEAKLTAKGGINSAIIDMNAHGAGIHAEVSGSLPVAGGAGLDQVDFHFAVDTLDRLGELIGAEDMAGPKGLEVSGALSVSEGFASISDLNARLGDSAATGNLEIDLPQKTRSGRPKVYGDIAFEEVNLVDLMPDIFDKSWGVQPTEEENTVEKIESIKEEEKTTEEADKGSLFGSTPLPNAILQKLDIDLLVTAKALEAREFLLEDFEAILTLQNGVLILHPLTARVGKGAFDGRIIADSRAQPAFRKIDFYMEHASFRNFGGTVEVIVDLEGSGDTAAELMAGLNGEARLLIRGAEIKKSAMTEFGSGLLESINPFSKESDTTELICAIVHLDIKDGFVDAKNKIAAQTNEVTWFGNATIDLKTEEFTAKIHPKPRRGLGISTSGLAKLVYVSGTLSQPKLQLDPKDFALKYGKYAAAISTGGVSLLIDLLFNKAKANADVCENIIKNVEKKERKEKKKLEKKEHRKQKTGDPAPVQPVPTKTAEDRALEHLQQGTEEVQVPAKPRDEAEVGGADLQPMEVQPLTKESPQKTWPNPFLKP